MPPFFSSAEAARRYDTFRPKVHRIVLEWLHQHCGPRRWKHGLDIECGTGDSTVPLREICGDVLGIDASEEMLAYANAKGLHTHRTSFDAFQSAQTFDLISTCMAFHWFDPAIAIRSYKALSSPDSTWIIYNFAFAGHPSHVGFNDWFHQSYLKRFPSPPRARMASVVPRDDPELTCIGEDRGQLLIDFGAEELVGYLSTQSNIENAVRNGSDYDSLCTELQADIRALAVAGPYRYAFSYEIHRCRRG
jgi:SAM-dependent methyltransferase